MSETAKVVVLSPEELKSLVREAVTEATKGQTGGEDRLLEAEEASKILSVSEDWIYRHARRLPFTRKLGPKMLRFSLQGIQKWIVTRKPPNTPTGP